MIIFTILCIIFVFSFISFFISAIILDKVDIRLQTCKLLIKIEKTSEKLIAISFLGIGICCFIALIRFIFGRIHACI